MTIRQQVFNAVHECEGLTAEEIGVLIGSSREETNRQLIVLLRAGKVSRRKEGKQYVYFKGTGAPGEPEPRSPRKKREPSEEGWHARYDDLVRQNAALIEWQRSAIARYPDLAVPEVTLRARKIAAEEFHDDRSKCEALLAGLMDDKPLMKAIVRALEEAA